jgi:hypothetical protein
MNSSLVTADRSTHLKIVAIALLAGMLVIWIGISMRATMTIGSQPSSVLQLGWCVWASTLVEG